MQCWPWQNGELALAELGLKWTRGVVEVSQTLSYSGNGDDYDDADGGGDDDDGCGGGDDIEAQTSGQSESNPLVFWGWWWKLLKDV